MITKLNKIPKANLMCKATIANLTILLYALRLFLFLQDGNVEKSTFLILK